MAFYLNEISLVGQFEDLKTFIEKELPDIGRCVNLIRKCKDYVILKTSDFYKAKITHDKCVIDLLKVNSEEMTRFRLMIANEFISEPFWDEQDYQQNVDAKYIWNELDVTASSMAEATEKGDSLLSFSRDGLIDNSIEITKIENESDSIFKILSIHSDIFLVKNFSDKLKISYENILKVVFRNTRLDFSQMENKYSVDLISKQDFDSLVSTLNKFVNHESFESIGLDDGLEYKKYNPMQKKKDRFSSAKYKGKTIMKFRFSQRYRVFGYRKDEKFFVLGVETDHRISDYG